jgi:hypothetical protein
VFGHKDRKDHSWQSLHGTIVSSAVEQRALDGQPGLHEVRVYTVDIRQAGGRQRVTVPAPPSLQGELPAGTAVRLQLHGKTHEIRFDPENVAIRVNVSSMRDAVGMARELRAEMGGGGFAAAVQQFADLAQQQAATHQGSAPEIHMTTAAEAQELMQKLLAGATDREDAKAKIKQFRAELAARAQAVQAAREAGGTGMGSPAPSAPAAPAAPEGFSSPGGPAGFDLVTPAAAAPPVPPVAPVPPVTPAPAFGAPASFDPVTPASTFAQPASPANPFDTGGQFAPQPFPPSQPAASFGGFGESKSDRIAALEDQRDPGQISPQQFQTLRQQIQDEF